MMESCLPHSTMGVTSNTIDDKGADLFLSPGSLLYVNSDLLQIGPWPHMARHPELLS